MLPPIAILAVVGVAMLYPVAEKPCRYQGIKQWGGLGNMFDPLLVWWLGSGLGFGQHGCSTSEILLLTEHAYDCHCCSNCSSGVSLLLRFGSPVMFSDLK
jgi:hypothetical protein